MKNLRNYLNVYLFQVVKGTAGLVGDALTFKWAQASMAQVAVNTVVVVEVKLNQFSIILKLTTFLNPYR